MFRNKICIKIILVVLFGLASGILDAQEGSSNNPEKFANINVKDERIDTAFFVRSKKLGILIGDKRTCETDNKFVIGAFKIKSIDISNSNYDVLIKKNEIHFANNKEPFVVFQYFVDFKECKKHSSMRTLYEELKDKEYQTAQIEEYEYPVTCYFFMVNDKLVLMSHYGLASYYKDINFSLLIEYFKKAYSTQPLLYKEKQKDVIR